MQNIKVIIGASYGDEGKGLATDFFGAQASGTHLFGKPAPGDGDTVNVLTNGGPQRGHTVELADGRRHVFKHFGAATFRGAETYFAEQFLVNPMAFIREYDELCALDGARGDFATSLGGHHGGHLNGNLATIPSGDLNSSLDTNHGVHLNSNLGTIPGSDLNSNLGSSLGGNLNVAHRAPVASMHPRCRFTTPWDMLTNQMLQEMRGIHNSCGFGIWETVLRYQRGFGISFAAFAAMNRDDRITYLRRLRDGYFAARLTELGLASGGGTSAGRVAATRTAAARTAATEAGATGTGAGRIDAHREKIVFCQKVDTSLQEFFYSDELLFHFEEDCEVMRFLCPMREEDYLRNFRTVLFENAQGLMLDGNAEDEKEFTTPSTTGVGRVVQTVERVFHGAEVEVCYVTRSFLTRHGDGSMENELSADQLRDQMPGVRADVTNVENRFQGNLRYGMMDVNLLAERIRTDFAKCGAAAANHYRPSVMVTHMNEFAGIDTDALAQCFGTLYLSDGRTDRDTHLLLRK